jgi:hypothetical protein
MRPIGELMKEMGFNKDAPLETQKAFIRHLIAAANGTAPAARPLPIAEKIPVNTDPQLSFDPSILGIQAKKSAVR